MPRIRDLASHPYPFVTVEELADCLTVTTKTIYRHIDKGALHVVRIGGTTIRIPIHEARRYAGSPPPNGDTNDDKSGA